MRERFVLLLLGILYPKRLLRVDFEQIFLCTSELVHAGQEALLSSTVDSIYDTIYAEAITSGADESSAVTAANAAVAAAEEG